MRSIVRPHPSERGGWSRNGVITPLPGNHPSVRRATQPTTGSLSPAIQIGIGLWIGGVEAGVGDPVRVALEGHELLRPQQAEHPDLLLDATAAGVKVLAHGLEI